MIKCIYAHNIIKNKTNALNDNIYLSVNHLYDLLKKTKANNFINPKYIDLSKDFYDKNEEKLLLTFDDGFKGFINLVLPILEKFQIPAMLFITTEFVNGKRIAYELILEELILAKDEINLRDGTIYSTKDINDKKMVYENLRLQLKKVNTKARDSFLNSLLNYNNFTSEINNIYLKWEDIIKLDEHPLITIGAHTQTHPVLSKLSIFEEYREIKNSKKELEKKIGHRVDYFSYPYGANSYITRSLAKLSGIKYAFTTDSDYNNNLLNIPRKDLKKYNEGKS